MHTHHWGAKLDLTAARDPVRPTWLRFNYFQYTIIMFPGLLRLIRTNAIGIRADFAHTHSKRFSTNGRFFQASQHRKSVQEHLHRVQREKLELMKFRNRSAAYYSGSVIMFFAGLSCVAVPFYRYLCKRTGWGGNPITDNTRFTPDKVIPIETNKRIKISFTCQASGILPWKFTPLQKEVYIVPGETALVFYRAKNLSSEDIVGMATYSVTPDHVAPYFNKIQCFCFEEQRLAAGEEVDMPVFFFIDPDFAKDSAMRNIDDVVLNYSFFKASHQDGSLSPVPAGFVEMKASVA